MEELGVESTIRKLMFVQEFYDSGRKLNILEMFFEVIPNTTLESNSHL
jgi:truncated hemoglobin YjbI